MKHVSGPTAAVAALSLLLLGGCAAKHVDPADRDTSGAYDGIWVGEVDEPRARREMLAGNWYMSCDWEPHEVYLVVDDGRVQFGRLEGKTPVSSDGDFRIDLTSGEAGMNGGVMPGNAKFVSVFSGNLAGDDPRGKYLQFITAHGANGCNAPIRFRRHDESAA